MEARYKFTKTLNSATALNTGMKCYSTLSKKRHFRSSQETWAFHKPMRDTVSSDYIKCTLLKSYLSLRSRKITNPTLIQAIEHCQQSIKNLHIKNSDMTM